MIIIQALRFSLAMSSYHSASSIEGSVASVAVDCSANEGNSSLSQPTDAAISRNMVDVLKQNLN